LNLSRLFDRFERLNNDYLSSLNIKLKIIPTKEFIHADENKILRVLQFLTTFSTRMLSKDGGVIQISTEKVNSRIHIRFEDNGPGIPKETQKNIFKTFISNTQSDLRLDMTIVASIIEAHEGTIVVETDRAIGTSFLIKIPVNN
jgi:signal transduction histidine kinase